MINTDLIDRQAAIDALDRIFDSIPMEQTTEILTFRRTLRELPSVQPEQKWIPVTEGLPEPRTDVWVNSDIGQIQGYYEENVEIWYASFGQGRDYLELIVNAWMPLPKEYSGE